VRRMPETHTTPPYQERFRLPHDPPAARWIVAAVVTEVAAALEPVGRDPFIDGSDDLPRLRPIASARGRLAGPRCG
jgi:hypothetical protein